MSILQRLLDFIGKIDPEQVKDLLVLLREFIGLFQSKGFVIPAGFSSGVEGEKVVEACVAKGCSETEARELVKSIGA